MSTTDDARELQRVRNEIARLEEQADKIRGRIKDDLGAGVHDLGDITVEITHSEVTTLDRDRLEAALGDRLQQYLKKSPRWTVKVRASKAEA